LKQKLGRKAVQDHDNLNFRDTAERQARQRTHQRVRVVDERNGISLDQQVVVGMEHNGASSAWRV